jgi:hypothetical protein
VWAENEGENPDFSWRESSFNRVDVVYVVVGHGGSTWAGMSMRRCGPDGLMNTLLKKVTEK